MPPFLKENEELNDYTIDSYVIDNVTIFSYLYNPKVAIKNPNFVIKVTSIISNNSYYYGTFSKPVSLKEIFELLKDYMYAKGEYELFRFKETNFKITINQQNN